jgi:hypothetical protein
MPDLLLLLALEVPDGWFFAGIGVILAALAGAVGALWKRLGDANEAHDTALEGVADEMEAGRGAAETTQAETLKALTAAMVEQRKQLTTMLETWHSLHREELTTKDAAITALQKALSTKSDDHADKIEQLQAATLAKVEELMGKQVEIAERAVRQQSETNAAIRELSGQQAETNTVIREMMGLLRQLMDKVQP